MRNRLRTSRSILCGVQKCLIAGAAFFLLASAAFAADLKGKVIGVSGQQVRLSIDGDLLPQVGDEVTISFQIPGGPLVRVGKWKVSEVKMDLVEATLVTATGTPTVDQIAIIQSLNPTPRKTLAPVRTDASPSGRGYVGAKIRGMNEEERRIHGFDMGIVVEDIQPGAPADRAGLKAGDIILRLNGKEVVAQDLAMFVGLSSPGQTVGLTVLRAGTIREYNLTVGARP